MKIVLLVQEKKKKRAGEDFIHKVLKLKEVKNC